MTLRSLFVDCNSYFASVEQEVQPALRGRPLAVVPVAAETTCCIAASYEAKAFGIGTGTLVAEARLHAHGIYSVVALTAADAQALRRAWGSIEGAHGGPAARGMAAGGRRRAP